MGRPGEKLGLLLFLPEGTEDRFERSETMEILGSYLGRNSTGGYGRSGQEIGKNLGGYLGGSVTE